jgi:hypothetical protein
MKKEVVLYMDRISSSPEFACFYPRGASSEVSWVTIFPVLCKQCGCKHPQFERFYPRGVGSEVSCVQG